MACVLPSVQGKQYSTVLETSADTSAALDVPHAQFELTRLNQSCPALVPAVNGL